MSTANNLRRGTGLAAALLAGAVLMSGCAPRNSVIVGSIPDDYRTNHPIVIAEREETIDLPVGSGELRMSRGSRAVLSGFMAGYDLRTAAPVRVLVPSGSVNAGAASHISREVVDFLGQEGVHPGNIIVEHYGVSQPGASAPIRVSYLAMRAGTGPCGRWPEDMMKHADNKHWANFGCSYQNNLAAQVANPADFLGPRRPSEIDPENRANAIDQYKARAVAEDFNQNSEIDY